MSKLIQLFITLMLLMAALLPGYSLAHELQPGTLEMRQISAQSYELTWRAPNYFKKPHPARLALPAEWQTRGEVRVRQLPDAAIHQYILDIPAGKLDGNMIRFIGLENTITDVFARFIWLDGSETRIIARPSQPWIDVVAQRSAWQVAGDYTVLGVEHILSGFDHLTFVFALLLIIKGIRRLIITVTAFTLAHSITLAAATLGLLRLPGPPVEAVIALSILFLASELLKVNRGKTSMTAQSPWLVAFVFGLLHGFGFAGALTDIGLPQHEVVLALLMFNVGVELGQLFFIGVMLALGRMIKLIRYQWPAWLIQLPAYGIGGLASFWLIERVAGF